jgi:phosphoenolpyruvate-protein kinase (PTS system EI component)
MNLGMNVEVRHSGKLFEVASTMLKNAVEAKNAKLEKKLRMVELQLKKQRVDQMNKTGDDSADIVEGEGYVVGDRNELLKQILDRVDNDKKDK